MTADPAPQSRRTAAVDLLKQSRAFAYILGGLTLAAGLVLLLWPGRTITVVARVSGVLLIVLGVIELVDAFRTHRAQGYAGLLVLRGIFNLAYGAALVFWAHITITVLVWLFGANLVLTGLLALLLSTKMPEEFKLGLQVRGALSITFGIVVIAWPKATLSIVAYAIAAVLILIGIVLLATGRKISRAAAAAKSGQIAV